MWILYLQRVLLDTHIWMVPLKTPMTIEQSPRLSSHESGGDLQNFFMTQFLTNQQKICVVLEQINKKLYVLIQKGEQTNDILSNPKDEFSEQENSHDEEE